MHLEKKSYNWNRGSTKMLKFYLPPVFLSGKFIVRRTNQPFLGTEVGPTKCRRNRNPFSSTAHRLRRPHTSSDVVLGRRPPLVGGERRRGGRQQQAGGGAGPEARRPRGHHQRLPRPREVGELRARARAGGGTALNSRAPTIGRGAARSPPDRFSFRERGGAWGVLDR